MDIQQLRYFIEIVDNKSYTKAAEKLLITQPMLTRVIQQLEDELDVRLIERTSRFFRVTEAGEILYQHASRLMFQFEDIHRQIDDMKVGESGEVRLSIPGVILDVYFPRLLQEFYHLYPNIDISIIEEGSKLTIQSVLTDNVDLGLVMMPVADADCICASSIIHSVCRVVVSKAHRFAGMETVPIEYLKNERIITFSDTATLHDSFIELCESTGFSPHIAYKSLMPNFIFDMVGSGICVAVIPYPVIRRHMPPDMVSIPISPSMPWEISIIYRSGRYQAYAACRLLDFMHSYFSRLEEA